MAGTTSKGFRFPTAGDNPAVHTDIENLAEDVDAELDDFLTTATANTTFATKAEASSEDQVRFIALMLGGM